MCITSEKRHTVNAAIAVLVGLADHFVDLVVSKLLADGGHDVTQFSSGNETIVIAVENLNRSVRSSPYIRSNIAAATYLEGLTDLLLRVGVLHLAGHHGQELCQDNAVRKRPWLCEIIMSWHTREINSAVVVGINLVNHVLQLGLGRVLSQRAHDSAQFLGGDLA